jgi:hypothetical protein
MRFVVVVWAAVVASLMCTRDAIGTRTRFGACAVAQSGATNAVDRTGQGRSARRQARGAEAGTLGRALSSPVRCALRRLVALSVVVQLAALWHGLWRAAFNVCLLHSRAMNTFKCMQMKNENSVSFGGFKLQTRKQHMSDIFNILAIDFGIQTVMGIVSIIMVTEKFYDLTGAVTYILMCLYDLRQTPERSSASTLIANV